METNIIEISKKRATRKPKTVDSHAEIAKIAWQLHEQRGYQHGRHDEDWAEAEAIYKKQTEKISIKK